MLTPKQLSRVEVAIEHEDANFLCNTEEGKELLRELILTFKHQAKEMEGLIVLAVTTIKMLPEDNKKFLLQYIRQSVESKTEQEKPYSIGERFLSMLEE